MKITTASDLDGSRLRDNNPGRVEMGKGPKHSWTQWDHLKVPGGGTLGETDDLTLRRIGAKLNIESAATMGRAQLADAYARLISTIGEDAKKHAIEQWLIATGRLT